MISFDIGSLPVPIVFCYIGDKLPNFVVQTAQFAALRHPNNPVYLLTSTYHSIASNSFKQFVCNPTSFKSFLTTIRYEYSMPNEWIECVFAKWFFMQQFLDITGHQFSLLLDSDILFYDSELMLSEWLDKDPDVNMLIVPPQKYRINSKSPSIASCHAVLASSNLFSEFVLFLNIFFSDPIEIHHQDKYLNMLQHSKSGGGIGDMFAIDRFQKLNPHRVGFLQYAENNMNVSNGYEQFLGIKLFRIQGNKVRLYPLTSDVAKHVSFLHFQGSAKRYINSCIIGGHFGVFLKVVLNRICSKIRSFL